MRRCRKDKKLNKINFYDDKDNSLQLQLIFLQILYPDWIRFEENSFLRRKGHRSNRETLSAKDDNQQTQHIHGSTLESN